MRKLLAVIALSLPLSLSAFSSPAWPKHLTNVIQLAEQGDPEAQFALGTLYRYGQGTDKNLQEALKWWTLAAEQGNVRAQFTLGDIYSGGYKLERNYVLAYMWFDIIAQQKDNELFAPVAQSTRDALLINMTAEEVSQAQKMATDWIAEHGK